MAAYAGRGPAPAVRYRRDRADAGRVGVVDGWIVAAVCSVCALAGGGVGGHGSGRPDHAGRRAGDPGRHNVSNALAAVAVGLLFGVAPDAIRAARRRFTRRRAPPRAGRRHRRRPLRQRLAGHPARRRHRRAARFEAADRAHRRRPRQGRRPRRRLPRSSPSAPPPRCSSARAGPTSRRAFRAAGLARTRARGRRSRPPSSAPMPSRVRPSLRDGPACAAGDRAAQPGRGELRHVRGLRGPGRAFKEAVARARGATAPREGTDEPRTADPRASAGAAPPTPATAAAAARTACARTANRPPAKSRAGALQRERHQPDYLILVAVVALAAIGILMVYSSSAMRGYVAGRRHLRHRRAADPVGVPRAWSRWSAMMRVDYRYLRLASVPFFVVAVVLLVLVFVPAAQHLVGGSAPLAPARAAARRSTRPRSPSSPWSSISPTGWPSAGTRIRGFWGGTVPFLIIVAPVIALVVQGARPRHDRRSSR